MLLLMTIISFAYIKFKWHKFHPGANILMMICIISFYRKSINHYIYCTLWLFLHQYWCTLTLLLFWGGGGNSHVVQKSKLQISVVVAKQIVVCYPGCQVSSVLACPELTQWLWFFSFFQVLKPPGSDVHYCHCPNYIIMQALEKKDSGLRADLFLWWKQQIMTDFLQMYGELAYVLRADIAKFKKLLHHQLFKWNAMFVWYIAHTDVIILWLSHLAIS